MESDAAERWRRRAAVVGLLMVLAGLLFVPWVSGEALVSYFHLALVDQPQVGPYLPMVGGLLLVLAALGREGTGTRAEVAGDRLP